MLENNTPGKWTKDMIKVPKNGNVAAVAMAKKGKSPDPIKKPRTKEKLPNDQSLTSQSPNTMPIRAVINVGMRTAFAMDTFPTAQELALSGPKANKIPPKTKVTKKPIKAPRHMYLLTNSLLNKVVISALSNKG